MSQRTNKSAKKRFTLSKDGRVLARKPGQSHFNAKAPRTKQLKKRKPQTVTIKKKKLNRLLPHNT